MKYLLSACAFSILLVATSTEARANWPACGAYYGGFSGLQGYGLNLVPYTLGHVPVPPYFALHPPVYYSYPVPRSYGYSPYPYPGTVRTPEIEIAKPEMIENSFYKPKAEKLEQKNVRSVSETAMVINPYATVNVRAAQR